MSTAFATRHRLPTDLLLASPEMTLTFDRRLTALILIDPYNDFISDGGKVWDQLKAVAEANDCVPHMLQVLQAARQSGVRVFYVLHRRYRQGDYETWKHMAPVQRTPWLAKVFAAGSWGGQIRPEFEPQAGDIVTQEHWCSSGFANTDLDMQLRAHGIEQLIIAGLIVNACVEATVRDAAERGYRITVVRDATAGTSTEAMHAALDGNIPDYASDIATGGEVVDAVASTAADRRPTRGPRGGDRTAPRFRAGAPLPGHMGSGMHVRGYPQKLALPPYVKQAHRLFARFAELPERGPEHDDAWFDCVTDALVLTRLQTA